MTVHAHQPSDMPQVGLELRRLGELFVMSCPCGQGGAARWESAHTLSEHLWRATRDLDDAAIRAAAYDAETTGHRYEHETQTDGSMIVWPVAVDVTGEAALAGIAPSVHDEWRRLIDKLWSALRDVQAFVDQHRPDRTMPTGPVFTDTDWCRNHLDVLGVCEPRFRGDTCRRCYGVKLTTGSLPPRSILEAWRDGARVTDAILAAAIRADKKEKANGKGKAKGKRQRAS